MKQGFQRYLLNWFQSPRGKVLLKQEQHLITCALENKFGYYLIQLGAISESSISQHSRISNKVLVLPSLQDNSKQYLSTLQAEAHQYIVHAEYDFLPFGEEKADLILLPHTLDSLSEPHHLLRQCDKSLIPEGYIVISGFNPFGCLSLRLKRWANKVGFDAISYHRSKQVQEWLKVLGYEIESVDYTPVLCFSSTDKYKRWGRLIEKFERSLQWLGFEFGNVYCIVAKKKVDAPTLVGMKWHLPSWKTAKNGSMTSQGFKPIKRQNHK